MRDDLAKLYADRREHMKRLYAAQIAAGRVCQECVSPLAYGAGKGKPQTCFICKIVDKETTPAKPAAPSNWKARKRTWNNGREYWVVASGARVLCGPNGGESTFGSRADAIQRIKDMEAGIA